MENTKSNGWLWFGLFVVPFICPIPAILGVYGQKPRLPAVFALITKVILFGLLVYGIVLLVQFLGTFRICRI